MPRSEPLGEVQLGDTLRLRLTLVIRDMHMEDERHLVLPVRDMHELEVTYRRPTASEQGEEADRVTLGDTMCTIAGTWKVSDGNREHLLKLAREGGAEFTQTVVVFGVVPNETGMSAWDALPSPLRDMLDGGMTELARAAGRTLRLMRWHWQLPGEPNPFRLWCFSWSPDGTNWQDLPWKTPLLPAAFVTTLRASETREREIASALESGADEPTGHELLREALHLVGDSPRSALIVGIAAAEIGFKEFVGLRVPAASWLVTETPTPPLLAMLTRYLPDLLKQLTLIPLYQFVEGKEKGSYIDPVLRELDRGIAMRNRLAHKPVGPPDAEDVKSVLAAVQDLLGMLDYYSGRAPFGKSFMRTATHAIWFRPGAVAHR